MNEDPQANVAGAPLGPGWQQALDELEQCLRQAVQAIGALRDTLVGGAPPDGASAAPRQEAPAPDASAPSAPAPDAPQPDAAALGEERARSTFERLWERIELEKREREAQGPEPADTRRGVELLPQDYLMTVEDREGKVDLIPLHRALLAFVPVECISLLSFANGVPVISLRSNRGLDLDRLGTAVSSAMDRQCEVIPQDNGRVYLRLQARPGQEA
jgi:hypothetical protein